MMVDRSAPGWTRALSYIFTGVASLCLLSLSVFAVFFQSLVAQEGQERLAFLLAAVALVPVIGACVMDYAHARAMAGYRKERIDNQAVARVFVSALAVTILTLVHPFLGAGILGGALVSWLGILAVERLTRREPLWDFRPSEAVSLLSGRDAQGVKLASANADSYALWPSFRRMAIGTGVIIALAVASLLTAREVLSISAILSVLLITVWSVEAVSDYFERQSRKRAERSAVDATVLPYDPGPAEAEDGNDFNGLKVRGLKVEAPGGRSLLSDIEFDVPVGSIIGVIGDSAAGKSLLLKALSDPFALTGTRVTGQVMMNFQDLWHRDADPQQVPCAYLPERPVFLPASGGQNLTCFHEGAPVEHGKRILEQLVFASDIVEDIFNAPDARFLPGAQQKALAFARAFLLAPQLYLMDRPEDGTTEKLIRALTSRLMQERRLGRSFLLVTGHRNLLEICDKLLVLQEGRVVDFGNADDIRGRLNSGWARLVAERSLESEDNLDLWIRSHLKRDGDEANRRKVCMIASELLAFSCQSAQSLDRQELSFEFKHFEGHCILKLVDSDRPVSTAQIERARLEVDNSDGTTRLSPLAAVVSNALTLEGTTELDKRVLQVKIATYDPRKSQASEEVATDAEPKV